MRRVQHGGVQVHDVRPHAISHHVVRDLLHQRGLPAARHADHQADDGLLGVGAWAGTGGLLHGGAQPLRGEGVWGGGGLGNPTSLAPKLHRFGLNKPFFLRTCPPKRCTFLRPKPTTLPNKSRRQISRLQRVTPKNPPKRSFCPGLGLVGVACGRPMGLPTASSPSQTSSPTPTRPPFSADHNAFDPLTFLVIRM